MKSINLFFAVCLLNGAVAFGQGPPVNPADTARSESTAREILSQVRKSLGGEENFSKIRSLAIGAKNHYRMPDGEIVSDLRIEFLAPNRYHRKSDLD